MTRFVLNTAARFIHRSMGREGQPLVVIDDVLQDPQTLVDHACALSFSPPPGGYYPGLNAELPLDYVTGLTTGLRPLLEQVFGLPAARPVDLSGYFGLATQAAEALQPVQTLPHHDSTDPRQLAIVHYLARGAQGGTGFYRQNATGFESVDSARQPAYAAACAEQLAHRDAPALHVGPQTPGYTQIDASEALFNRLIVYRTTSLHSGLLEASSLTNDPATGRLTANVFVRLSSRAHV